MGMYINPTDGSTKEKWLLKHGRQVMLDEAREKADFNSGPLPVCLVDNGPFTAAGICYDARELEAFTSPTDYRPKYWFLVDKELLEPFMQ